MQDFLDRKLCQCVRHALYIRVPLNYFLQSPTKEREDIVGPPSSCLCRRISYVLYISIIFMYVSNIVSEVNFHSEFHYKQHIIFQSISRKRLA